MGAPVTAAKMRWAARRLIFSHRHDLGFSRRANAAISRFIECLTNTGLWQVDTAAVVWGTKPW